MTDAQYDANNRLISRDGVPYTYDANGNLTSDGASTYTWNERDQLIAVTGLDTLSYAYDGLGRRTSVTKNGQTTTTLYDGVPIALAILAIFAFLAGPYVFEFLVSKN